LATLTTVPAVMSVEKPSGEPPRVAATRNVVEPSEVATT
jgi:hypothetical protein